MKKKIISLALSGVLLFTAFRGVSARSTGRYPLGGDKAVGREKEKETSLVGSSGNEEAESFDTMREAGDYIREQLKAGKQKAFSVSVSDYFGSDLREKLLEEVYRFTGDNSDSVGLWFYAGETDILFETTSSVVVYPVYGNCETREEYEYLNDKCKELARNLNLEKGTEEDRAAKIFDYLVQSVRYDEEAYEYQADHDDYLKKYVDAYNAYGALVKKKTMCMGYTETFSRLAAEAGIETDYAHDYEEGETGGHAYNLVKIDGKWYGLDACWGDIQNPAKKDPYFLYGSESAKSMEWHKHPASAVLHPGKSLISKMQKKNFGKEISAVPVYRLYNPNSGEHFYTESIPERDYLTTKGWVYENIAWKAPEESSFPIYRLYNANAGDHHYTVSLTERDALVRLGWKDEGVMMYAASGKGTAVYRLYNPNAKAGAHLYTKNSFERDMLKNLGWKDEGEGWIVA